jgi:hypothetical protein
VHGVVHVAGDEMLSKAEWARTVADTLALGPLTIEEVDPAPDAQVAPRPDRVQLRTVRHAHRQGDVRSRLAELGASLG